MTSKFYTDFTLILSGLNLDKIWIKGHGRAFSRLKVKPNYLWQLKDLMEKNTTSENKRNKLNQTINDITSHGSVVHFYFKETGVVLYNRDELYGIMDLVGKLLFS